MLLKYSLFITGFPVCPSFEVILSVLPPHTCVELPEHLIDVAVFVHADGKFDLGYVNVFPHVHELLFFSRLFKMREIKKR